MVVGEGFEPSKSVTADLQSAPFGRSGIHQVKQFSFDFRFQHRQQRATTANLPAKLTAKGRFVFTSALKQKSGGGRRIRTFEVCDGRFTVCSLWPLGNPTTGQDILPESGAHHNK